MIRTSLNSKKRTTKAKKQIIFKCVNSHVAQIAFNVLWFSRTQPSNNDSEVTPLCELQNMNYADLSFRVHFWTESFLQNTRDHQVVIRIVFIVQATMDRHSTVESTRGFSIASEGQTVSNMERWNGTNEFENRNWQAKGPKPTANVLGEMESNAAALKALQQRWHFRTISSKVKSRFCKTSREPNQWDSE